MSVVARIEACFPSFTKSEEKIGCFVIDHQNEGVEQSMLCDLAKELGVGEATIVRFCRKLGFEGFKELKFSLAVDNERNDGSGIRKQGEIKENLICSIKATDSMVSKREISAIVDRIRSADDVFFFGIGTSGLSASMGEARLFRFGKRTRALVESHAQSMQASLCDDQSLVMVLSVSGETKDLIESVSIARQAGACIVTVTSYLHSTLAELSDYVLISSGRQNYVNAGGFSPVVSQMYLLDLITSEYASRCADEVERCKQRVARSLINKTAS